MTVLSPKRRRRCAGGTGTLRPRSRCRRMTVVARQISTGVQHRRWDQLPKRCGRQHRGFTRLMCLAQREGDVRARRAVLRLQRMEHRRGVVVRLLGLRRSRALPVAGPLHVHRPVFLYAQHEFLASVTAHRQQKKPREHGAHEKTPPAMEDAERGHERTSIGKNSTGNQAVIRTPEDAVS